MTQPREVLRQLEPARDYLLVDGYNIIFSWDDLNEIAKDNMDAARPGADGYAVQLSGIPPL